MYVTKRGDKFRAWERVVINGKVRKISVTIDRDTAQARKKAAEMLRERMDIPVSDVRYPDLVKRYIKYQQATVKASTWVRNRATLTRLEEVFGNVKVEKMTAGYISAKLLEKTKNPGTYNEYLARVKALMRWAYQHDYLTSTACIDKLVPLKEELTAAQKVQDKYLEADELKKLLEMASPYYSAIFEFLALSGLRIGELIALDDASVTDTDIIVKQTYDVVNGVITSPKTANSWRYVHIQPELAVCIRKIRQISRQHCLLSRQRPPYFVVSRTGGRLSYFAANREFKKLSKAVADKELTPHALRHTHVALMAEKGIRLDAIAARCGHSSSKITKEIYYHCTKKQREIDNAAFDSVSLFG